MMKRWHRFNLYFVMAGTVACFGACHTEKSEKKEDKRPVSTLRLHQEMHSDPFGRTEDAFVFRDSPVKLTVGKEPFLSEANVKEAKVVNTPGGFALSIQFDRQGEWLLEQYTAATKGKHIAIYSQFMPPEEHKLNSGRWLAAPLIQNHIADGLLIFTPDASREETDRIVLGLNEVARKLQTGQEIKW